MYCLGLAPGPGRGPGCGELLATHPGVDMVSFTGSNPVGQRMHALGAETVKRVSAQLDTLIGKGVRHVVLSAFGCGAFLNPAALTCITMIGTAERRPPVWKCLARPASAR